MMLAQQARIEAERCLNCFDAPCTGACPARIDVPTFIGMVRTGNTRGAAEVVKSANPMANVCGKICPEEIFCQSVCNRARIDAPIAIRELHFFATQYEASRGYSPTAPFPLRPLDQPKRVAVIGGGPAGLSCAFELAKFGCAVDLFERDSPGGVPAQSIPSFRLSRADLQSDLEFLSPHFTMRDGAVDAGQFERIRREYDAVFVSVGLGRDRRLGVPGETLKGVYPVLRFLEPAKRGLLDRKIGDSVVVIGGGNVSLDAAATARRLGASTVVLIYRRSEAEMKVWKGELEEARKCGVEIRFLTLPMEILGEETTQGVRCRRTALSDTLDASGRREPVEIQGSDFTLPADSVIIAIGQEISAPFISSMVLTGKGYVMIGPDFRTSIPGVYAGGDAVAGEGTIVQAVAHGKAAAHAILGEVA